MAEIIKTSVVAGVRRLNIREKVLVRSSSGIPLKPEHEASLQMDSVSVEEPSSDQSLREMVAHLSHLNTLLEQDLKKTGENCSLYKDKVIRLEIELDSIKSKSVSAGYEQGYSSGQAQGKAVYLEKATRLAEVMGIFETNLTNNFKALEKESALLAYEALLHIVGQNLGTREFLVASISTVLKKLIEKKKLKIRLNASDFDLLEMINAEQPHSEIFGVNFDFVRDDKVKLGGCIIDSDHGIWDARIESQLERIKEAFSSVGQDQNK